MAEDSPKLETEAEIMSDPAATLTNGLEDSQLADHPADAAPSAAAANAPEAADTGASGAADTVEGSEAAAPRASAAPAAEGEAGCPAAAAPVDNEFADTERRFDDIRLSNDLDSETVAAAEPEDRTTAASKDAESDHPVATMEAAASLDSPLPASTARIKSDAFFEEEDDPSKFTLDDETPPPVAPLTEAPAASASAEVAERRAQQDLEDEEIQQKLRASQAASASDPSRSLSPPVHDRPMSPPPGAAPRSPLPPPGVEPPEFRGLLYYDGVDSVGRPVVVVNARADAMLQPKLRNKAMEYMKARLEPIVYQGPYVLVMVASGHQGDTSSKLPAMWLIRAYRTLSRPYKKNVKFIILVRPSATLSTMMVILRPFLSLKAARKLHKVDSLLDIDSVTGGDVKAEQLGANFLQQELGVEPGASLTPTAPPPQRAESLDAEVQLGSYSVR